LDDNNSCYLQFLDFNNDFVVNDSDSHFITSCFTSGPVTGDCTKSDLNSDTIVDVFDEAVFSNNMNVTNFIPVRFKSCNYCNSSWININSSCSPEDYYNITYEYNNTCCGDTGLSSDCNIPENTTVSCDFCTPILTNSSWSDWLDLSCLENDVMNQTRSRVQYDANYCGEVDNITYTQYRVTEYCDYCTPSLTNTSWSEWVDETECLSNDTQIQNRTRLQYDSNICSELGNITFVQHRTIACDYCTPNWVLNDTWSECDFTNHQYRNWYDVNNCAEEFDLALEWGYQEDATFSASDDYYLYLNYTKLENSTREPSFWQVKHGFEHYNITLPQLCWDQEPLQLRLYSNVHADYLCNLTENLPESHAECYSGSGWILIGEDSSGGDYWICGSKQTIPSGSMDGDWDTYSSFRGLSYGAWYANDGLGNGARLYEDAMWWSTQGTNKSCENLHRFSIPLNKGWNLISIPLKLENETIPEPVKSIEGNCSGLFAYLNGNLVELTNDSRINETIGFWINCRQNTNWSVQGSVLENAEFNIGKELNLIGYPSLNISLISKTFNGTNINSVSAYYNQSWVSYNPEKPDFLNALEYLKPGYGYLINAKNKTTLKYP